MREIITKSSAYKFEELNDDAKQIAINRYCEDFDFSFHADCVIDDAKECAKILGIDINQVYYSGFSSQGDGANFEGDYRYKPGAVQAIMQHAPKDAGLHEIAKALQKVQKKQFYKLRAYCEQSGHYQHSGCMRVSVYHTDDRYYRDIGESEDIGQLLREFADWIYKQLETEYWYRISDDTITDYFNDNDYEFTENGRML